MLRRYARAAVALVLIAPALAACGGGAKTTASGGSAGTTLTYWASNQGASLETDKQVLQPELDKFAKQTGVTVKLEVIG